MRTIKLTNNDQKPRERLLRLKPDKLSDSELLTIVFGSGNREISAHEIAGKLLSSRRNDLRAIFRGSLQSLSKIPGIGRAKYCTLLAGMELGRRMSLRAETRIGIISSAKDAYLKIREFIPHDNCETILAIFLDSKNRILTFEDVSAKKHPAGSELDLRKFMKIALDNNASGVILAHNHPSGDSKASKEDIRISQHIEDILMSIGLKLLDHLIITADGYSQINW